MSLSPPRPTLRLTPITLVFALSACPPIVERPDAGPTAGGAAMAGGPTAGGAAVGGGSAGGTVDAGRRDAGQLDGGSPGRFFRENSEAVTARRIRCGFYSSTYLPQPTLGNLEEREAFDRAAADGRLTFDAARAEQCLAALASQPCNESDEPLICRGVVTGLVPEGGDCYTSLECATGGRCLGNTCPRQCLGLSAEGEFATSARPCGPGLTSNAFSICERLIIQAEGQDCLTQDGGIPRCDRNLFCRRSSPTVGTCSRRISAGASCTSGDVCEEGTQCTSGACLRFSGVNEPCTLVFSSASRRCQVGLRCEAPTPTGAGLCQLPAPVGTRCLGSTDCTEGLICPGSSFNPGMETFGTCAMPPMLGESCSADAECGRGRFCGPSQGNAFNECQVFRLLGERCGPERCASPYVCRLGRCEHACHDLTP